MRRRGAVVLTLALLAGLGLLVAGGREGDSGPLPSRLPPSAGGREPRSLVQRFVSRPDLQPPAVRVDVRRRGASRGKVFLGPKVGPGQRGPMIVDGRGQLVWFRPLPGRELAFDVRAQRYRGRQVLTWWQGRVQHGHGHGVGMIADRSYRVIARVRAVGAGLGADLHEFKLTPRGTALITVYRLVHRDLRSVGGSRDGIAVDSIVQEIDVRSGRLLFEWHSLDHVGFDESYWRRPKTSDELYDYFHVNSIDVERNGNLLISARNTSALYEIDRRTGRVLWRLGGKRSDFRLGRGVAFRGQHDARRLPDGTITLFDNGFPPLPGGESRVITLRLNRKARTATLVHSVKHPLAPHSHSQGGEQILPNGNTFVGWGGAIPNFSEYAPSGRMVWDAHFGSKKATTYRAYRMPWTGLPHDRPAVAVRGRRVFASWNGATEVASWRLLGGRRPNALRPIGHGRRTGFETALRAPSLPPFMRVEALDASGAVLGRSKPTAAR